MPARRLLAADGGNSKTDLALLRDDGTVLAAVRGPGCSPHLLGVDGALEVLGGLVARAGRAAGLDGHDGRVADLGAFYLAGVDLPVEEARLGAALAARGWSARTVVANDTFAILRAGTARGWGVATVCGAGLNCVGVAPDGRRARYAALGAISGDWGGGLDVGLAALGAAIRGRDGRGPRTALERLVPAYFGLRRPAAVTAAIHLGRLPERALTELPPLVLAAAADGDRVAGEIVDRLGDEVAGMTTALLRRLGLVRREVEVVLGGGILQAGDARLLDRVRGGILAVAPRARVLPLRLPPIAGAALLGLEVIGVGPAARHTARLEVARALLPEGRPGSLPGSGPE
jgi:N-acetylglucosamine kinase-like BadF-type ATPase